MKLSWQAQVIVVGATKFYTGIPCKRGHLAERYVRNRECVSCKALADRAYSKAHVAQVSAKQAAWRLKNPDAFRKYAADYYERNKKKCHAAATKWAKNNPEKVKAAVDLNIDGRRASAKKYRLANPHIAVASENLRRARLLNAAVPWADIAKIQSIYEEASKHGMHVDHIVPLAGKNVCGLHVETNLRLLHPRANCLKGNRLLEEFC